jgi:hypothetical protein
LSIIDYRVKWSFCDDSEHFCAIYTRVHEEYTI